MNRQAIIHTMKPNVLDILFDLKRGTERISAQEYFWDSNNYNEESYQSIQNKFRIQIDEDQLEVYRRCDKVGKEYLLLSLLKTVAFDKLCQEALHGFQN